MFNTIKTWINSYKTERAIDRLMEQWRAAFMAEEWDKAHAVMAQIKQLQGGV